MSDPKVSVIIPTYNRAHLITKAVESVLAQTYTDYKVIVIDDGSTDATHEALRPYSKQIHYIRQENSGISGARNRGISLARGEYMAFLDSDDEWLPQKLEKQVSFLDANSAVGLLCCHLWRFREGEEHKKECYPKGFPKDFQDLLNGPNFVPTSTAVVRRRCIESVGLFDESIPVAEDWDLWLRIAKQFKIFCLDDVLATHLDHRTNTTNDLSKVYEGYWRFYSKVVRLHADVIRDISPFQERAASFEYLLGTTCLRKKQMRKALFYIAGALRQKSSIGIYFARRKSLWSKTVCFLKPYAAFAVSLFGAAASVMVPGWRS